MKNYHIKRNIFGNAHGGVLVLVAILLVVFISIAALAIDIGQITSTRNELQNVADAAALAGAAELATIYLSMPAPDMATYEFTKSDITKPVLNVAILNKASNVPIEIDNNDAINNADQDIIIGVWQESTGLVDPTLGYPLELPDAVYVKARRDSTKNSPITTFFAGIMGIDQASVTAEAVAALSGPSSLNEGQLVTPFGISEKSFPDRCEDLIYFSPTTKSCAGWHNFQEDSVNSSDLSQKIIDLVASDRCDFCEPGYTDYILPNTNSISLNENGNDWLHANFTPQQSIESNLNTALLSPTTSVGVDFKFIGGETDQFNGEYLKYETYNGNTGTPYKAQGSSGDEQQLTLATANSPSPIYTLFDYFRYRDGDEDYTLKKALYESDGVTPLQMNGVPLYNGSVLDHNDIWSTMVPVYADDPDVNCDGIGTNVGGFTEIVGFAKTVVIRPNPPPAKDLNVIIDCSFSVVEGRGGGGNFGQTKGSIPTLVK